MHRVKDIIHSSDKMDAGLAVLMMEKNCRFEPLRQKLGRLKHDCNDMGTLMAGLVKYADSYSTKDPASDDEKTGKGKKNGNERVSSITRQVKEAKSVRRTVTRNLWPMHKVTIRSAKGSHPGLVGQDRLLSNYSMSPARNTAPGNDQRLIYGRIAQS